MSASDGVKSIRMRLSRSTLESRLNSPLSSMPFQSAAPVPRNLTRRSFLPASPISDEYLAVEYSDAESLAAEYPAVRSSEALFSAEISAARKTTDPDIAPTATAPVPIFMNFLLSILCLFYSELYL